MPIVIALHGPHVWERAANNIKLSDSWSLAIAHMEETALMLSDWALRYVFIIFAARLLYYGEDVNSVKHIYYSMP